MRSEKLPAIFPREVCSVHYGLHARTHPSDPDPVNQQDYPTSLRHVYSGRRTCRESSTYTIDASLIIQVNAILLLPAIIKPQTLTPFLRKILFLNPLFMIFNTVLLIATAIPVTLEGRNGKIHSYIAAGGVQLPSSVFEKQAAALGLAIN